MRRGHGGLYRLNNIVLSCRLNALNCVSSSKSAGKLFHTRGPATEKISIAKSVVCAWYKTRPVIGGTNILSTTFTNELNVDSQVRRCQTRQQLVHEAGDLELDSLANSQPVQKIRSHTEAI